MSVRDGGTHPRHGRAYRDPSTPPRRVDGRDRRQHRDGGGHAHGRDGDDPYPDGLYTSLDGEGDDVNPPPARHSLGRTGDGAVAVAFPTDSAAASVDYAGRGGGSGEASP
jgi:hypothetical protein